MKDKIKPIIITVILIVSAVLSFILIKNNSFEGYEEGTTSNTSLNLLNGGKFCEDGDRIYFSNIHDHNYLYSMDNNLEDFKLIKKNSVLYINAKSPYVFYSVLDTGKAGVNLLGYKNTGLYRTKISNGNTKILDQSPTGLIALYGNNIYYQHYDKKDGLTLYETDINGDNKKQINENSYLPVIYSDGKMIFPSIDNNQFISAYDIENNRLSTIKSVRAMNIGVTKDYYYYMDLDNDYAISVIHKNSSSPEQITDKRCASYNISPDGKYLYYQIDNEEDNGLYKLNLTTLKSVAIKNGNHKNICVTKDYVFFTDVNETKIYYCSHKKDKVEILDPPTLSK